MKIRQNKLILCLMFADVMAVDKIEPNRRTNIIKTEGEPVTLSCSYESDSEYVRLYWYRQYHNGEPQYLLHQEAEVSKIDPRFCVNIPEREHVDLEISSAAVSDCSVLLCSEAHSDRKHSQIILMCNTVYIVHSHVVPACSKFSLHSI
uniref:T-cell receptor alpha/delta variable 40.0 n=1 Tax=Sinocyclocheilus anshuiensis TaxID=1608454 RepID=A0A671K9Z7_9TELE